MRYSRALVVANPIAGRGRGVMAGQLVVDGLAARLAAKQGINSATAKRLHRALVELRRASDPRALTRRAPAHADFHATIAEASGNRHMLGQIPMIRFTAQMGTRYVQHLDGQARLEALMRIEEGKGNHGAILQAIEQGDARKAERAARDHIRTTADAILRQRADEERRSDRKSVV